MIGVKLKLYMLGKEDQMGAANLKKTRRIDEQRIHVERVTGRARRYAVLNHVLPVSMASLASHIVHTCFLLTKFD